MAHKFLVVGLLWDVKDHEIKIVRTTLSKDSSWIQRAEIHSLALTKVAKAKVLFKGRAQVEDKVVDQMPHKIIARSTNRSRLHVISIATRTLMALAR